MNVLRKKRKKETKKGEIVISMCGTFVRSPTIHVRGGKPDICVFSALDYVAEGVCVCLLGFVVIVAVVYFHGVG